MYRYFISYSWSDNVKGCSGYANCEVQRPAPINSNVDIKAIKESIEEAEGINFNTNVVILYWRLFE